MLRGRGRRAVGDEMRGNHLSWWAWKVVTFFFLWTMHIVGSRGSVEFGPGLLDALRVLYIDVARVYLYQRGELHVSLSQPTDRLWALTVLRVVGLGWLRMWKGCRDVEPTQLLYEKVLTIYIYIVRLPAPVA